MKNNILKKLITLTAVMLFAITPVFAAYNKDVSEADFQRANAAYRQGLEFTRLKAYDRAVEAFQTALRYHPGMSDAYYNIGSIYAAQDRYDDAYNNYVKAIALNPRDYDSIVQAAKIAYNRKNYNLAMKYLKYVPQDAPQYSYAQQLYADAHEMFVQQRTKIERAKITTATPTEKVLIDKFKSPAGIVVDSAGNMYVACYSENAVVKVDKNKNRTNIVKDYLLDGPVGLAMDRFDNLYIANFDANNILKVTKGGNVSIFMDNIAKPYFLYIKNDILYVSEQGNDAVVKYNLNTSR